MEFLFVLFVLFIAFNVVKGFVKEAKTKFEQAARAQLQLGQDGRLRRIEPPPAAADPWWETEPAAELPVEQASAPVQLAAYADDAPVELTVAPRPLPAAPVALDVEVDRAAEHERLHARIDQPPRRERPAAVPAAALRGLRDRDALRRAIVASEVLGPPRALRELD